MADPGEERAIEFEDDERAAIAAGTIRPARVEYAGRLR